MVILAILSPPRASIEAPMLAPPAVAAVVVMVVVATELHSGYGRLLMSMWPDQGQDLPIRLLLRQQQ